MKKEFQIAYVPIGVPTFHLESAQKEFDKSVALIKSLTDACVFPKEMLLSIDLLDAFLEECQPDLVILQNITFANAAYASEVLKKLDCPILLWTLREPVIDGGRLRLNSLTGAYSAANAIKAFRKEPLNYIFGSPEEEEVRAKVGATIRAAKLKYDMRHLTVAAVGHTPQGFGFGRALDLEMLENFGASLESIEARELIDIAKGYSDEDVKDYLADAGERMCGLENTPEQNRKDFARLYRAYKEYVKDHHVGALASRCWPDFFTAFGTPVCAVLAMLNDLGVAASCEADTYGALSMYLGMQLTQQATFFGDPVSMDEKKIPSLSGIVERQPALWQERIPGQRSMYTAIERLVQPLILDVSHARKLPFSVSVRIVTEASYSLLPAGKPWTNQSSLMVHLW